MWPFKKKRGLEEQLEQSEKDVKDLFALAEQAQKLAHESLSIVQALQPLVGKSQALVVALQSDYNLLWNLVISNEATHRQFCAVQEAVNMLKSEPEWVPEPKD